MLLGNFNQFNKNPGRAVGGPKDPSLWFKAGTTMQFYMPDSQSASIVSQVSFPNGYTPPYSWILAPKAGGMSSVLISGAASMTNTIYGAKAMVGPLVGGATITDANMGLIVNAIATLTASGVISDAGLNAAAQMTATLAASGDVVGALTALGHLVSTITADGSLTAVNYAIGHMTATIGDVSQTLTAAQVAQEVWNSLAADYTTSGTMGKALSDAGGSGNPWASPISGNTDPGTFGEKVDRLKNPSLLIDGEVIV